MGKMKQSTVMDYLLVITRERKFIVLNFIIISFLAVMVSLLLPKWYRAETTVLSPRKESGLMGLSSLAANIPFAGLDLLAGSGDLMTYNAILESRGVMEAIANQFHLQAIYKEKNMENTIKVLRKNVIVEINKERGALSVGVLDKKPDRAADMANAFIIYLDSVNSRLNIQKARNDRLFIEKRFHQNEVDLAKAEEELKRFQEKYKAVALPKQTEATIKNAADLQAAIFAAEMELGMYEQYLAPDHITIVQIKMKLFELRKKLDEIEYGFSKSFRAQEGKKQNQEMFIPFSEIPQIGLVYARLLREVEVQNKLYGFLIQQYEQAKILEAKNTPTVQVLDRAIPPVRKAKPRRMIILLFAIFLSLLFSLGFIILVESIQRLKETNDERYAKLAQIQSAFKKDGNSIIRKFGLRK